MKEKATVGRYLVKRLEQIGLNHVFGVPGDYVLKFFDLLVESPIELVGTCNELNAGYAADAYARYRGAGAVCVTYGVGAFSLFNAVAGAYAEHIPLIVICGGPKLSLRKDHDGLLHHVAGYSGLQREIYSKITAASFILDNPDDAPGLIDSVINDCLVYRYPVFIEIPADMVDAECDAPSEVYKPDMSLPLDETSLDEAVTKALSMLKGAKNPAILAGGAFSRLGIVDELLAFAGHTGFPLASVVNSKGMIPETLPSFAGIYCGKLLEGKAKSIVEDADVLLVLGVLLTDFNKGLFTSDIKRERMIYAHSTSVSIGEKRYDVLPLGDFVRELKKGLNKALNRPVREHNHLNALATAYKPRKMARLTSKRFWTRLNSFLKDGHIVVADAGSATLESAALNLPEGVGMLVQDFYLSIGYSLPASMGVKFAKPESRPVVLIGDGAFQMTCQELSTIIRSRQNPVIFLLNNDGYQIERVIYDNVYNDIQPWKYHALPEVFGGRLGLRATTEGELEDALKKADNHREEMVFIEVCIDRFDYPATLEALGKTLR